MLEEHLAAELSRASIERAVVVTGRTLGEDPAVLGRLHRAGGGRVAEVLSVVQHHSPLPSILDISRSLRANEADGIIALGGGSAIVSARAAAILLAEGEDVRALCTRFTPDNRVISPRLEAPKLPIVVVPTTPTTAAGKAGSAITVEGQSERLALYDPKTRAQAILIDDELLAQTPEALLRSAGLNALVMAIEGLLSPSSTVFSDAQLAHAAHGFAALLPRAASVAERTQLVLLSLLVGDGTDTTGGGATAGISHATGWRYGASNGVVDAMVLPYRLDYDAVHRPELLRRVESILRVDGVREWLETVLAPLPLPARLREIGVRSEDLPGIAQGAHADFAVGGNPSIREGEVEDILRAAW